jgi:hypothetical protein
MPSHCPSIQPSADCCYGRDDLCQAIVQSAFRSRSVLLFGGRQAGKTTAMLHIAQDLGRRRADAATLGDLDVAIYVNLMTLPDEARPVDFFRYVARLAREVCERQIVGFSPTAFPSESHAMASSLEGFVADIEALFGAAREVRVRLLFLLDESKRILGARFPRGFHDNLFSLLYGVDLRIGDRVALVFAGAQDLYRFCEDDTSPIGSRAAFHFVEGLPPESVQPLLVAAGIPANAPGLADLAVQVFKQTGGHAGLTARLAESLAARSAVSSESLEDALAEVRDRHAQLMRLWTGALSSEARVIQPLLHTHGRVSFRELARILSEKGLDPIRVERVGEELSFTGIARKEDDHLVRVNVLYWTYYSAFAFEETGTREERDVWRAIEEVELTYRALLLRKYEAQWPGKAIEQIERILGPDNWQKVRRFQESAANAYPYSPGKPGREVMECLYLGQLGDLIVCNQAWSLFKHLFRDKRHLQDLMAAINPVRNDQAHFAKVPPKELTRCGIACDDLLVIGHREEQAVR